MSKLLHFFPLVLLPSLATIAMSPFQLSAQANANGTTAPAIVVTTVAAGEETCTKCSYYGGDHHFGYTTCTGSGGGCFGCEDTPAGHIGCHSFPYEGECSVSGHTACGASLLHEEAIMGALERNEFTAVAMRVAQSFGEVTLTASDHAIRIHGCSGSIVAYIPLSARAWANVNAMRLTAAAGLTSGYAGGF